MHQQCGLECLPCERPWYYEPVHSATGCCLLLYQTIVYVYLYSQQTTSVSVCSSWQHIVLSIFFTVRPRSLVIELSKMKMTFKSSSLHSSIHSRQSHIHSVRRRVMERPAGSRHSCAVTRGLQTAPEDISVLALIPWHCHLTYNLCIRLLYVCRYWWWWRWWWWWWWWCIF